MRNTFQSKYFHLQKCISVHESKYFRKTVLQSICYYFDMIFSAPFPYSRETWYNDELTESPTQWH
jgi:hypothetical protein